MLTRCMSLFMVIILATGLACAVVFAATDDNSPVSLDLKDVDSKAAVEALFRGRSQNYAFGQEVAGTTLNMTITDVPFSVALKTLLKSAGLVYRVENGVYMISKKPETSAVATVDASAAMAPIDNTVDTTTTVESIIDKIPLNYTGASDLLAAMNGTATTGSNGSSTNGLFGSAVGTNTFGNSNSSSSSSSFGSSNSSSRSSSYGSSNSGSYGRTW